MTLLTVMTSFLTEISIKKTNMKVKNMKVFITGTAGFIGFHLAKLLLDNNHIVHGYDGITEYYDINLKNKRHEILENFSDFSKTIGMLEDNILLMESAKSFEPDVIIHLAAQAGVRYSLENSSSLH